jgi:hypothetical protein
MALMSGSLIVADLPALRARLHAHANRKTGFQYVAIALREEAH